MNAKQKSKLPTKPIGLGETALVTEEAINIAADISSNTETTISAPEVTKEEAVSSLPVVSPKISHEYKVIVTRNNLDMFQLTVEEHLNKGWELSGGVSCTMYADSYSAATIWSQAVYKKTTN
jgi:hypothetical protein